MLGLSTDRIGRRQIVAGLSVLPLIGGAQSLFAASRSADVDQPHFRFVPRAYEDNLCFLPSQEACDICGKPCIWTYAGNVYAVNDPASLCARCIADGSLTRHFGNETFGFHDNEVDADPAYWEEINHRTPGIPTWNPIKWPVIGGMPLAYVASGESKRFPTGSMVDKAVTDAWSEIGWDTPGDPGYVLLFKQIDGPEYRAIIDFD